MVLDIEPDAEEKSKLMLIGKVLSSKVFTRTVVKEIITKAWNTSFEVEVAVLDKNIFSFSFRHEGDVRKVWDRRPWSFRGEHLILKMYEAAWNLKDIDFSVTDFWVQIYGLPLNRQNPQNLEKIGRMMGKVLETDLSGNGIDGWKHLGRVRVEIELERPLRTSFPLDKKNLSPLWIPFKYEKLGKFCYGCGLLGHEVKSCLDEEVQNLLKEGVTFGIHGNWFKAESNEFQPGIDLKGLGCLNMAECVTKIGSSSRRNESGVDTGGDGQSLSDSALAMALAV